MTELLVGTKKGLFLLDGEPGAPYDVKARAFAGEPVEYATRDPRSGRLLASVTHAIYGPKVFVADDPAGEWRQAQGVALDPCYGWAGEGQRVVRHAAPGIDLVGVVGRAALATLAAWNARQAVVPIAAVGDEAVGRDGPDRLVGARPAAARANRFQIAAPREARDIEQHPQRLAG